MYIKLINITLLTSLALGCSSQGALEKTSASSSDSAERWHLTDDSLYKVQGLSVNHRKTSIWARLYVRQDASIGVALEIPTTNCVAFSEQITYAMNVKWNDEYTNAKLQCIDEHLALLLPLTKADSNKVLEKFKKEYTVTFKFNSNFDAIIFSAYDFTTSMKKIIMKQVKSRTSSTFN